MSAPVEPPSGEVRVYEAADGEVRVDVRVDRETVWLTQEQMSQLFGRERIGYYQARPERVSGAGAGTWGNMFKICTSSNRGDRTVTRD